MEEDELYMRRAIALGRKGLGYVNPNPLVGAVIVKDGRVIGEGYHARYGEAHAEREAIAALGESAEGATLYVTLEPCCHYGKQPPCTEAILAAGIKRVVIGSRDPNPKVSGGGVKILREAGILVEEDFLREECDELNRPFFHYITKRRPYVVMKYAMTLDGKIATNSGRSQWISCPDSREAVHKMRHAYMGIMAGIGTVLADDPMLNCRLQGGKDPVRIICDSRLRIPLDSKIVRTANEIRTVIATAANEVRTDGDAAVADKLGRLREAGVEVLELPGADGQVDLPALMDLLGEEGIDSILLEGGGTLNEAMLRAGLVQEMHIFLAPKAFGGRAKSPIEGLGVELVEDAYSFSLDSVERIGQDLHLTYQVRG